MPRITRKRSYGRKRRTTTTRRPRRYRKRVSSRPTRTLASRPGRGIPRVPFPPSLFTTFSYTETFSLVQAVAAIPQVYQFRLNSLYDPNLTGGGTQPRYFDTLCGANNSSAPYNNYRVHAAKIKATFWPTSSSATNSNGIVAIIPHRDSVSSPSAYDEISETAYSRYKRINALGQVGAVTVSSFVKMKTHLGHKDLSDVDDSASAYNNNPGEVVVGDIILCAVNAAGTMTCDVSVTITFFAQLYTLNDVADS